MSVLQECKDSNLFYSNKYFIIFFLSTKCEANTRINSNQSLPQPDCEGRERKPMSFYIIAIQKEKEADTGFRKSELMSASILSAHRSMTMAAHL